MIRFLNIQNLAVVERLELGLQLGRAVLNGETSAGKSIVLGALGLLVGGRATSDLLQTGESKAVVQAIVKDDQGREIIHRREIMAQGRGRTFIDDTLATASAFQTLGQRLIDHLRLLDVFGGLAGGASTDVADRFRTWRVARGALDRLRLSERDTTERTELLTFQRNKIDRVAPIPRKAESLSTTEHGWRTRTGWRASAAMRMPSCISETTRCVPGWARCGARSNTWRSSCDRTPPGSTPHRRSSPSIEARLADLERLKKKARTRLHDVLARLDRIDTELDELGDSTARLVELTKAEASRRRKGRALGDRLTPVLADLAIPKACFEVRFEEAPLPKERWSESGVDAVEFYFSVNPGETLRRLAKVASGGELLRVMLGLKTLASTDEPGKTLVFDEVDAGIGGRPSRKDATRTEAPLSDRLRDASSANCRLCDYAPSRFEAGTRRPHRDPHRSACRTR